MKPMMTLHVHHHRKSNVDDKTSTFLSEAYSIVKNILIKFVFMMSPAISENHACQVKLDQISGYILTPESSLYRVM